jgi:EAL domain-containing protein (putative c-di-GMP-specific phosphodiesterase class I)
MQPRSATIQPPALTTEARGDLGDVIQAVLRHTRFNLRQLQPGWLEACAAQHAARLGCRDLAEHVAALQRQRSCAEELLAMALQPPPATEEPDPGDLRAGTRALLDSVARTRSTEGPLDVWVLVPEGSALLTHLREHIALAGPAMPPLRLHGPAALCALHGTTPNQAAATRPEAPLGDVRQTLNWLAHHLPDEGPDSARPVADLILATDLFTCWRPDLQRQWLGRLAGALRSGGLLLLGRPKALWRAPRGLRAVHVDGLHWLQRSRAAGEAPGGARRADMAGHEASSLLPPALPVPVGTVGSVAASIPSSPPAPFVTLAPPAAPTPAVAPAVAATEAAVALVTAAAPAVPTPPLVAIAPAAAAAAPPALADIGTLTVSPTTRRLSLNAAMRRLLAWPAAAAAPDWNDLLGRFAAADRAALEQALFARPAADAAAWTLTLSPSGGTTGPLQLRGEPALDPDGQPQWHCLALASALTTPAPAEEPATVLAPAAAAPAVEADPQRLSVVTRLAGAAARQELELLYQPQLDVAGGSVRAVEALLRWHHPQLGQVAPRAFVPWAEECGLIIELGRWVLQQACRQARRWRDLGVLQVPIAVNVSAVQLQAPDFVAQVEQALTAAGVPAQALELELTETTLLQESEAVRQNLAACRRLGVHIALDDFGTGQTNLARLHRLPLDKLKLDPSFIRNLCIDRGAQAIVRSMVALGHQLGLAVVAEGVEQAQQLVLLDEARCDAYQGHHATPALSADALTRQVQQTHA